MGKNHLLIAFVFGINLLIPLICSPSDVDDLILQGENALKSKDYMKSVQALESASKLLPSDPGIRNNLIFAYESLAAQCADEGHWDSSIMYAEKALALDRNNSDIKHSIAVLYNNQATRLLDGGEYAEAIERLETSLSYDPKNEIVLKNLSMALTKKGEGEFQAGQLNGAISDLTSAVGYDDKNWNAHVLLGEAYYRIDDMEDTVRSWETALQLKPDMKDIQLRLAKIKKEQSVEENFRIKQTDHFRVKYEGYERTDLAWSVLRILRDAYIQSGRDFNFYPEEPVTVIIYTQDQFKTATDAPDWTAGIYDGKIRVRIGDILKGEDGLRRVLYHEYAHAVIQRITGGNIPVWFNEGIAQYQEPDSKITKDDELLLKGTGKNGKLIPFESLDKVSVQEVKDEQLVRLIYVQSKSIVHYMVDRYGFYKVKQVLYGLGESADFKQACGSVLYKSPEEIEKGWRNFVLLDNG
jgi:tetratricopeptide (TPR) repeat protein